MRHIREAGPCQSTGLPLASPLQKAVGEDRHALKLVFCRPLAVLTVKYTSCGADVPRWTGPLCKAENRPITPSGASATIQYGDERKK